MGVRSKQLNLPDLYKVLDPRYGSAGDIEEITIRAYDWEKQGDYFVQVITNDTTTKFKDDNKLIIDVKFDVTQTYEKNLELQNLFAHIVKIEYGNGSLTVYSTEYLDTSFNIQVMYFK